jgi:rubrerythrin
METDKDQCMTQAIEMEKEGKAFYLKAAAKVESPLARAVFEELAKDEERHIEKIVQIYTTMKEGKPLTEWITCVAAGVNPRITFSEGSRAQSSTSDMDALRFGLDMEEKSIKYYQDLADKALDRREKRFYLALSQEEWTHYLKLMDSIEYMTDPVGWHYVHEKDMEDGG